jgi:hypothetical protein
MNKEIVAVDVSQYKIELLKEDKTVRTHGADSIEAAVSLIEGLRDSYGARLDVVWQDEEVDSNGELIGEGPDGEGYTIKVTPPLEDE